MPLQIIRQDITKMKVDAIVNTTNSEMIGYSGVDLAVHEAAGPLLESACRKLAPLGLGSAKITNGYNLDAKYIIHTSGPIWQGGLVGESIILKSCYIESLKLALEYNCNTVAFPLISSGAYGYPKDQVLRFATQVITEFLYDHELTVYICVFDRKSYELSKEIFDDISAIIDDDYVEDYHEENLAKSCVLASEIDSDFDDESEEEFLLCDCEALESCRDSFDDFSDDAPCYKETTLKDTGRNGGIPPLASQPAFSHPMTSAGNLSLEEYMKLMDKSFAYKLFDLIDEHGMTDVECYKKANIDKKTFSKIKCNPNTYKPSKQTAVAFAIALELNLEETQDLLASAGLTLSRSFKFDKIIRYFIQKEIYDIFIINEALFEFDQVLLGC